VSTFLEPMMEANLTMLNPAHAVKTDEKIKLKLIVRLLCVVFAEIENRERASLMPM
jgi:hypothetical protein